MIRFLLLILPCCLFFPVLAQNKGHVEIIKDARIDSLVSKHRQQNELKKSLPGYRIQLYSGAQRTKANDIRADFIQKFPDYQAYIVYQQPNFKVRVGDFRSRLEAFKLYKQLQDFYEAAFIVKDDIRIN